MTKTIEEAAKAYVESADTWSYGCEENHDITEQMCESFKAGANHVYGLPLASRLTAEEKERVRRMYKGELEFAQFYQRKANSCCNQQCKMDYEVSRDIAKSRANMLESIFGADFFSNENV